MRRIYEPENLLEAEMLAGMLASEGVRAQLVGRDLVGAAGELPIHGRRGLAVDEERAEDARQLIGAYSEAQRMVGDEPESFPGTVIC